MQNDPELPNSDRRSRRDEGLDILQNINSDGFDFGSLSEDRQRQVQESATAIHDLLGKRLVARTAEEAVLVGLSLKAIRECVGRNRFQTWLAAEFQWRQPAASKFMRSATVFQKVDCLANFQPSALYVLSRRVVPRAALAQALDRARGGEFITKGLAEGIVSGHGGAPVEFHAATQACQALEKSLINIALLNDACRHPAIDLLAQRLTGVSTLVNRLRGGSSSRGTVHLAVAMELTAAESSVVSCSEGSQENSPGIVCF